MMKSNRENISKLPWHHIPSWAVAIALGDALWFLFSLLHLGPLMMMIMPIIIIPLIGLSYEIGVKKWFKQHLEKDELVYLWAKITFAMIGFTICAMFTGSLPLFSAVMIAGLGTATLTIIPVCFYHLYLYNFKNKIKKISLIQDIKIIFLACFVAGMSWALYASILTVTLPGILSLLVPTLCIFMTATAVFSIYHAAKKHFIVKKTTYKPIIKHMIIDVLLSVVIVMSIIALPINIPATIIVTLIAALWPTRLLFMKNYRLNIEEESSESQPYSSPKKSDVLADERASPKKLTDMIDDHAEGEGEGRSNQHGR